MSIGLKIQRCIMRFTFDSVNGVEYNSAPSDRVNQYVLFRYTRMIDNDMSIKKMHWKFVEYID